MRSVAAAGTWGALFGTGLGISGLARPDIVKGMLDVTGSWDPTMLVAWVVGAGVYHVIYRWARHLDRPMMAAQLSLPTKTQIDARLITGAALFGGGWGIAGMCPGVVLVGLGSGGARLLVFTGAMITGMLAYAVRDRRSRRSPEVRTQTPAMAGDPPHVAYAAGPYGAAVHADGPRT